uniref:Uncharacterized protein n=1 Tax=Meloidogyne enterolobii TaxID=390850 RepID=A0A6V7TJR6_MELEN|nr:unnamed protein product [Meloidogyne enterolobii]
MLRAAFLPIVLLAVWTSHKCSVADTVVGYGRHTLVGNKITISDRKFRIAENNDDLKDYVGTENACDVKFDDNGDIVLNYNSVRETGCVMDLMHRYLAFKLEFTATLSNDDKEIKECLEEMPDGINANLLPFAHSIDLERFEKLKKGPYNEHAFCDNQAACGIGGGECLKPEGLEIGWGYKGDRVHVSMQQVGEPILCECPQKFDGINNKWSSIDVQVDDHIIWFRLGPTDDQCRVSFDSCNPPFVCNSVKQSKIYGLNPMTWEIKYTEEEVTYYRLLSLYLLPQKAAFQHQGGKSITRKAPNGPKCNIQLRISKSSKYKLLIENKLSLKEKLIIVAGICVLIFACIWFIVYMVVKTKQNMDKMKGDMKDSK